ncbi:MAG TPA: T9SS type A sorting domain-containing protein [Saprospiraceae bacterium]|nr:T9SS type A sorting domain-containing protein [Saprospiraceae bacterium]
MKTLFTLAFICFTISASFVLAQSPSYTIESFQDVYIELGEYESIQSPTDFDIFWEREFTLNFQFPYYDSMYNRVIFVHDNWGAFTDDEDFSLFLFEYSDFVCDEPFSPDPDSLISDIRYAHVSSNNMQAFVLQYTNNIFFFDIDNDDIDTYMNWQVWLFENGVMEIHFGEMHMDNNPIYEPGKGFFSYGNNGVDTSEIYGPHLSIANPKDESDAIALSGSYDDYVVTGNQYDVLTVMPPEGWIIRFKPRSVGLFEPDYNIAEVSINPNPATTYINIPEPGSYISIYDFSGKIVYEGIADENKFNISSLPPGIYFVRISARGHSSIGKFYKA